MRHLPKYLWALPNTVVGLLIAGIGTFTAGRYRFHRGTVECWGGGAEWFLRTCCPLFQGAGSMALGHVVLGIDEREIDYWRDHELVHVRQYEHWGPLFLPVYLAVSCWLHLTGRDPYLENPFEREAYTEVPYIHPPRHASYATRHLRGHSRPSG
jgi:hypothetical protein